MTANPRCERLWRDVGDDSPWYEKALFHALGALEHGDDPQAALKKIEQTLEMRPQELDPSIYEREAQAILDAEARHA